MEATDLEIMNAGPILTDLRATLQALDVSAHVYLNRSRRSTPQDSLPEKPTRNPLGIHEYVLPAVLQLLGIRSLTLNASHDINQLSEIQVDMSKVANERYLWKYLKNDTVLAELKALFQHCRTIAFDDWSSLAGASDLWNGLLTDVIKPIGRKDLEFIFYLGNSQKKLSFQVDEALDIISDFSRYGQVTFALDEEEAINLWQVLNGVHLNSLISEQPFPDLKRKYISIFRTMNIGRLLIYSATNAMLFTKTEPFALARRKVTSAIEMAVDARQNFIEGFTIGLLLRLEMPQCLTLGLIVFGSYGELSTNPEQKDLLTYMDHWLDDLKKPETLYLYQ